MHKLLEKENLVELPRVALGLGIAAIEMFIKPAVSGAAKNVSKAVLNKLGLDFHIPTPEEMETYITETLREDSI